MKFYEIKRQFKNLRKREREGTRNMYFLLSALLAVKVEIFFINVTNAPYFGTQHKKHDPI